MVYKVALNTGFKPDPLPDYARLSAAELVRQLESPSSRRRLIAQVELLNRPELAAQAAPLLEALMADKGKDLNLRIAGLFTYRQVRDQNLRVMDATAVSLCMEHDLPILVFDYRREGNIVRAIAGERAQAWEAKTSPRDAAVRLVQAMAANSAPDGYVMRQVAAAPTTLPWTSTRRGGEGGALSHLRTLAPCSICLIRLGFASGAWAPALRHAV